MTKFKRAISLLTATAISLSFCLSVSAERLTGEITDEKTYPSRVINIIECENMGEITKEIPLLNSDGETTAYCLECTSGYLIYDMNGNIVEYSPTNESPFVNVDSDAYYGGPLNYIAEENEKLIDINTNEEIEHVDFVPIAEETTAVSEVITDSNVSTQALANGNGTIETKVNGFPRNLNYNTGGYCGALAATQLFLYIADYKDSSILTSYYKDNPQNLYNYLKQLIPSYTSGYNLYKGMNDAMNSNVISLNQTAVGAGVQDVWGLAYYIINTTQMPSILLIQDHETYNDHWVVTYGVVKCFYNYQLVDRFYIVNNGYGKNGVRINIKYQYNLVYLS